MRGDLEVAWHLSQGLCCTINTTRHVINAHDHVLCNRHPLESSPPPLLLALTVATPTIQVSRISCQLSLVFWIKFLCGDLPMVISLENWRMLYEYFWMSHSNERSVQRVEGVLLCHRNQSWSSPSWQCHLELWVIAELFTEIPVSLDFIQTNAMYSGITEHSLKGKKEGLLLGMA